MTCRRGPGNMADSAREQGRPTAIGAGFGRRAVVDSVRRFVSISLAAAGLAWLAWLLVEREPVEGAWTIQVVLALATFAGGCWGEFHRYRTWTRPMRQFSELLIQIRGGEL